MNIRHLFSMHLLCAALSLMVYTGLCQAAQLRDIRIGEHDNFTRIVFELDTLVESDLKISADTNRVEIHFPDTRPNLIQKIPLNRTKHLENIQIWTSKEKLAATLELDANHIKVDSFPLKTPPRIALDIYWQDKPEPSDKKSAAFSESNAKNRQLKAPEFSIDTRLTTASKEKVAEAPLGEKSSVTPQSGNERPAVIVPTPKQPASPPVSTLSTDRKTKKRPVTTPLTIEEITTPQLDRNAHPRSNRLQYYLVIVLVIITIAILVLLVLMLLTRYRWINDDSPLSANEFLKRQEQRLTMLDERIKEQLKRYEDA